MVPLLADENAPFPLVVALRAAGADVMTAREAGLVNTPDHVVLASATAASRTVLTHDRDYIRLHKQDPNHAGIVYATADDDIPALAGRILGVLASETDLTGRLIRVYRPHVP
jgi:predicted nuclease of predicted toxin-antitoxin system